MYAQQLRHALTFVNLNRRGPTDPVCDNRLRL
jgi:hypothetical protein